ncbi:MAG: DNA repair protein RecN, partial [Erysipelotrichaceae bacterium]
QEEIKLKKAHNLYLKLAKDLSKLRHKKADELATLILCELKDLQLNHAQFIVDFKDTENKDGIDQVEFLISMNVGESLKPLNTTASGGELSRFMLGLKTIFTSLQGIETVVFDEIDTGISGSIALAIGKKMNKLAATTQVFAVTHLAQVAACAKQHYLVEKSSLNQKTSTNIKELTKDERIHELAFIANGSTSESSIMAANELYIRAQREA